MSTKDLSILRLFENNTVKKLKHLTKNKNHNNLFLSFLPMDVRSEDIVPGEGKIFRGRGQKHVICPLKMS